VIHTRAALVVVPLALAGCGGARVAHATAPVKGTVRYCATPSERPAAKAFNRAHAREGLTVRLSAFTSAKRFAGAFKRGRCDVAEIPSMDVARYAAAGALRDLTAHVRERRREFLPATLLSGHYAKRDWALPLYEDVGMLYARHYPLPKTLQALYRRGGVVFGDGPDTPLAFLETAYAAGGRVLTPDGRHSALDSAPNRAALALLRAAVARRRVIAASATGAYRRFVHGRARFMRNWSSMLTGRALSSGRVAANLSPLPPFEGAEQATLMLGEELVVPRAARNPRAALAFVDARVSVPGVRPGARNGYLPPLRASYSDDERINVLGGGWVMRALRHAATPPVSPHLDKIGRVIAYAVDAALSGRTSVERALHQGSRAIDALLANAAPGDES
jgi:multiple sugar transport system substrate-binding protein